MSAHDLRSAPRVASGVGILAAVYVAAARFGLGLDPVSGFATLVWAPTGLSLAALLIFGVRLAPGVAIGAFIANTLSGAPVLVALGIAAGNTSEALLGAFLLNRAGFHRELDRIRDALALVLLGCLISTTASATIGVASLYAGGIVAPASLAATWRAWWLGDVIGALIVAPLVLVWTRAAPSAAEGPRVREAAALVLTTLGSVAVVFLEPLPGIGSATFAQSYLTFPALMWAALRFGPRGAASVAFLVTSVAIWGTAMGGGPYAAATLTERLLPLQSFLGVAAATFLVLGAASAERARAIRDLESAVEKARAARDAAASANRSKSEFLAAMSHELRTPLNAIGGYVELIELGLRGPVSEEQRKDLSRIRASQRHLLGLIGGVLDLSRIEAGKVSYDIQSIDLDPHLNGLEELVAPQARARQQILRYEECPPGLAALADAEKLRQIMLNLLSNAIRHSPPGSAITISARALSGTEVEIRVSDNGPGIPESQREAVFEPFVQLDRTLTSATEGIGLGLAVSRDLARGMRGELRLVTEVTVGATFALVLPAPSGRYSAPAIPTQSSP